MTNHVVVALSVDSATVTFYTQQGEVITLKQGDPRLDRIMSVVQEPLKKNIPTLVNFEYQREVVKPEWGGIEKSSNGLIKFFRVAKSKVKEFFDIPETTTKHVSSFINPMELGLIPGKVSYSSEGKPVAKDPTKKVEEEEAAEQTIPEPVEETPVEEEIQPYIVLKKYHPKYSDEVIVKGIRSLFGCSLVEAEAYLVAPLPIYFNGDWTTKVSDTDLAKLADYGIDASRMTPVEYAAYLDYVEPQPEPEEKVVIIAPVETNEQKIAKAQDRMNSLLGGSTKSSDPKFHEPLTEKDTIIAVTAQGAVIPDVHQIKSQIRHAHESNNATGLQNFMERVGKVIHERKHSMEDLLKFLEFGDLPLADNGDIIIFKRLRKLGATHNLYKGDMQARYVDVHSGKVGQRVGSLVYMDAGRVDPNRYNSCSTGLHVATLGYLRNFSGDVTIIGRVKPEDVIAVPHNEYTKMRVAAYQILAELPDTLRNHVNAGKSLSDHEEGAAILHRAITGNYPEPNQHVYITGNYGSSVIYKDLEVTEVEVVEGSAKTLDLDDEKPRKSKTVELASIAVPKPEAKTEAVKPVKKAKVKVAAAKKPKPAAKPAKEKKMTNTEQAKLLWETFLRVKKESQSEAKDAARELAAFKRSTKKGWTALGLPADTGDKLKVWLD